MASLTERKAQSRTSLLPRGLSFGSQALEEAPCRAPGPSLAIRSEVSVINLGPSWVLSRSRWGPASQTVLESVSRLSKPEGVSAGRGWGRGWLAGHQCPPRVLPKLAFIFSVHLRFPFNCICRPAAGRSPVLGFFCIPQRAWSRDELRNICWWVGGGNTQPEGKEAESLSLPTPAHFRASLRCVPGVPLQTKGSRSSVWCFAAQGLGTRVCPVTAPGPRL